MTHNTVSLQVSLPQMLDLALGTPEVGSINLTILHNFLHVLLHQINLTNSKVEYRGDDATRLQTIISSLNTGPSVYLHEYSITDSEGNVTQRDHTPDTSIPAAEIYTTDSKSSIRKEKSSESTSSLPISEKNFETPVIKKTKGLKQKVGKGIEDNCQSIIFVEPIKDGLVPSALGFKKLNDTVEKLEQQFQSLEDLATNPEIIERIKTGRADPLNDMWSIININKRLDASEQGISKVMTLLQDVIKSEEKNSSPLKQNQDDDSNVKVPEESVNFNDRLTKLETDVLNINSEVEKLENLIDVKDKSDVSQQKPSEKNESSSDSGSEKLNEIKMKNLNMSEHSSTSSKTDDNEKINSETVDKSIASILSGSVTTACMLAVDKDKNNPSVSSITDDNESINSKTVGKSSLASVISGSVSSAHMLAADKNMNDPSISNETDDNEEINSKTDGKSSLARRISGSVTTAHMLAADKDKTQSHLSEHGSLDLHELKLDVETLKDEVAQTKQDVNKIRHQVKQLKADRGSPTDKNKKNDNTIDNNVASINELKSTDSGSSHLSVKHISDTDGLVQQQNYSANTAETSPSITSNTSLPGSKELDTTNNNFFTGNNRRKSKSMGVIGDSKKNHNESIKNLESRIAALERKIKVIDDPKNINQSNCVEEIQQLVASVNDIQNDIDKMKQSDAMYNEKEKHDVLIEQIELLKILKADKEDLEDALTEKADTDVVNRKVSYDRFQSTCYDITRNVEDAISKLTQQEKTWKVTLDNVQQEINNKLDRTELSPIEVFINNQLQVVHDKLEDLEEERRKNEAAGTKKFLMMYHVYLAIKMLR